MKCGLLLAVCCALGLAGCGADTKSSTVGWAVGQMPDRSTPAVLKTTDGISWTRIVSPVFPPSGDGQSVSAIDNQCAWITIGASIGSPGHVLRTVDGGATWADVTPIVLDGSSFAVNIKAISRDVAWIGTNSGFLASTNDGGNSWTPIIPTGLKPNSSVTHIDALDAQHVWAVGTVTIDSRTSETLIVRTRDGANWETMPTILNEKVILGLAVSAPNTVRITTNDTTNLYTSYDGGINWGTPVQLGSAHDLNNVAAFGTYVWAVHDFGIFTTFTDSVFYPARFTNQYLPAFGTNDYGSMWVVSISALDAKRIWIGGSPQSSSLGGMLWTDDGGTTWHEPVPSLYGYDIWRISFVGGVK